MFPDRVVGYSLGVIMMMATLSVLGKVTHGFRLSVTKRQGQPQQACVCMSLLQRRRWKSALAVDTSSDHELLVNSAGIDVHEVKDGALPLHHPDQLGPMVLPSSLSPSAVLEFKKCPQSYLLQYIYNLRQPTNLVLAKGTMCHEALEKIFDLEPPERTLEALHNLLRASWSKQRYSDKYRFLFESPSSSISSAASTSANSTHVEWDRDAEAEWGQSALALLSNYYHAEDPREIKRPNPLKREMWLRSHLTVDPTLGVTAKQDTPNASRTRSPTDETFYIRGIVDRLDLVKIPGTKSVAMKIVDYKTGKAPELKYSKPMNDKIVEEAFYQLKVYALLLREKGASFDEEGPVWNNLRFLELFYLTSESGRAKPWRYDLGETQEQRDEHLQTIHQDLSQVWQDISALVALQDPKAFVGCDRSFCYCHKCRERFVPGTLWEP